MERKQVPAGKTLPVVEWGQGTVMRVANKPTNQAQRPHGSVGRNDEAQTGVALRFQNTTASVNKERDQETKTKATIKRAQLFR